MNPKCYKSVILDRLFLLILTERLKKYCNKRSKLPRAQYLCQASSLSGHRLFDEFPRLLEQFATLLLISLPLGVRRKINHLNFSNHDFRFCIESLFSTMMTPGADQAAFSASSFSAQETTVPSSVTLLSSVFT
jgi:hypothetical protein